MLLDLILAGLAIVSVAIGYNRGLISTLLMVIGYVGGAVGGIFAAERITSSWNGALSIVITFLVAIFLGAEIGGAILKRIGTGIHKRILFGPFKFLDSILGGALSLARFALFTVLVLTIAKYSPWGFVQDLIKESEIYRYISDLNLLSSLTSTLLQSVSSHLDQLTL